MADAVTTTVIFNGSRDLVINFTNISAGTGESAVNKIALSSYTGPDGGALTNLILDKVEATASMGVKISTDQVSNPVTLVIGIGHNKYHFSESCPGAGHGLLLGTSGSYSNVQFSTIGAASNNTYNITLYMRKCG